MVAPEPLALATLSAPVSPFKEVTPLPAIEQVGQLRSPVVEFNTNGPEALTAKVPLAFGIVSVRLPLKVVGCNVALKAELPSLKLATPKTAPVPIVRPLLP